MKNHIRLYLARFPFDSNNPIGYFVAVTVQYIICGYEFFLIACSLALFIGLNWFIVAVIKEIRRILHEINKKAQANANQPSKLMELFSEFIYTHSILKQLSIISMCNNVFVVTVHLNTTNQARN